MTSFLLSGSDPYWSWYGFVPARSAGWDGGRTDGSDAFVLRAAMLEPIPDGVEQVVDVTPYVECSFTEPDTSIKNYFLASHLSAPLAPQTISGTMTAIAYFRQSEPSALARPACALTVLQPDGSVRGVLRALTAISTEVDTDEYEKRYVADAAALTPVVVSEGDRLLFEVGYRRPSATGPENTVDLRLGSGPFITSLATDPDELGDQAPALHLSAELEFLVPLVTLAPAALIGSIQTGSSATLVDTPADLGGMPEQDSGQTWPIGQRF